MRRIYLTNGGSTIVDDEDYNYLTQWKWQLNKWGNYAERSQYIKTIKLSKGKFRSVNKNIRMHRVVNKTPDGLDTDHINRDKLDNRKSNLRTTTRSQNAHNAGKKNNGSKSRLAGVQWRKDRNKWRSYICIDGYDIYLGSFGSEVDAHLIYISAKEQLVW